MAQQGYREIDSVVDLRIKQNASDIALLRSDLKEYQKETQKEMKDMTKHLWKHTGILLVGMSVMVYLLRATGNG